MMKSVRIVLVFIVIFTSFAVLGEIDRTVVMIFDQMRPDYIERFHLKNFERLKKMATFYPNAIVGHMSSETIVSHAVIPNGYAPKFLPWSDNGMFDHRGLLGTVDKTYLATAFHKPEIFKALESVGHSELFAARVHEKWDGQVIAVGEKNYATLTVGGPAADRVITLEPHEGTCEVAGQNIPDYIAKNDRYKLPCKEAYGTETSFYPLDGLRYFPGPQNQGGDIWTADVALEVMKKEAWRSLFITFGAIDKFGHMLGEDDGPYPLSFTPPAHLDEIARIADAQLGRILDALKESHQMEHTLIVVTSDHGGQTNWNYLGNNQTQVGTEERKGSLSFWLDHIQKTGKVRLISADTNVRVWVSTNDPKDRETVLSKLREISHVQRIAAREKEAGTWHYVEVYRSARRSTPAYETWADRHALPLLDTMANSESPDLVAILDDNTGFGKIGDHGGTQEKVQRIPMLIFKPGQAAKVDRSEMRLMDIEPLLTRELKLRPKKQLAIP